MALAEWFAAETDAYAALVPDDGENRTAALSAHHLLRLLGKRRFARGLALGPGSGGDYRGLAGRVKGWVAIEPARGFWTGELAGAPAEFRAPDLDGALDLPDAACDLAASFGALHHIANVSAVVGEIARVLVPGAPFLIREPIASLGDFRGPRRGVTRHERGVPHRVMDRILANAGFTIAHKSFANFPGVRELAWKLGVGFPWNPPGRFNSTPCCRGLRRSTRVTGAAGFGTGSPRARATGSQSAGLDRHHYPAGAAGDFLLKRGHEIQGTHDA